MTISSISSAPQPVVLANQAPKAAPFKRDRDGDYDNNAKETPASEAREASKGANLLNIKA
jgi:hypothetical protein